MDMNIELFVSKRGQLVFTCHGEFEKEFEEVIIDAQTGLITFIFKPDYEEYELNCTVNEELCKKVQNQLFCAIGYIKNNKLVASEYVRFICRNA